MAVAAVLSELELLVTKLVGVGIYDMQPKTWRERLSGKTTVDELCECPRLPLPLLLRRAEQHRTQCPKCFRRHRAMCL